MKLTLNNFGDFTQFSIIDENHAQKVVKAVNNDYLSSYCFESNDIIQTFIIELFEMTKIENIAIKKCKNCGKFFSQIIELMNYIVITFMKTIKLVKRLDHLEQNKN